MHKIVITILATVLLIGCASTPDEITDIHTLKSPSGELEMSFQLTSDGTPQYALNYNDTEVILPSNLGFELRGVLKAQKLVYNTVGTISKADKEPCYSFYDGFYVKDVDTLTFDETWEPVWGEEGSSGTAGGSRGISGSPGSPGSTGGI